MELTHASFFSGVGGLDLGLERAGWRTVSFSEIDPYASAVLAERWPGVPNLGDIVRLAAGSLGDGDAGGPGAEPLPDEVSRAVLWSGGFPCQDLSVAGKRAGFAGERSSLAFAFLDLVEQHRPPAILLENVPGLLSSHGGKDFGTLLARLGQLGYWWAYRVLDAQLFGVPQRRRRVFVVALDSQRGFGADSAAEVLSVGARCDGHSATGDKTGEATTGVLADGARSTRTVQSAFGHHGWTLGAQDVDGGYLQLGASPDSGGVREADGLAGRLDDRDVAATLNSGGNSGGFRTEPGEHLVAYRKSARVNADPTSPESWVDDGLANTLNNFDVGDVRTTHGDDSVRGPNNDPLLPLGLDSHRYRCCGNGVVSNVSEWVGVRLARAVMA